jgi:hypothetical protein
MRFPLNATVWATGDGLRSEFNPSTGEQGTAIDLHAKLLAQFHIVLAIGQDTDAVAEEILAEHLISAAVDPSVCCLQDQSCFTPEQFQKVCWVSLLACKMQKSTHGWLDLSISGTHPSCQ